MRRLLLVFLALVAALLAPAAAGASTASEVLALDRGELQVRFVGRASPPPAEVTLPLHWDAHWPRAVGWAQVRIRFAAPAGHADEPQALLVSRIGNAYRVKLNGQVIAAAGKLEQINDGWYVFFAPKKSGSGHVVVCIRVESTRGSSKAVLLAGQHVVPALLKQGYIKDFKEK